ncbi:MAG TPA: peptidoglycan-binding domain-containing protein [Candidatus Angelobacter sp.]
MVASLLTGLSPATTPPAKHTTTHSKATVKNVKGKSSKHRRHSRKGAWKRHGQQKIDASRATQIQVALIREKYLDGKPNGVWDSRTETAMQRYQADNGWQSKVTPDSRALIKLGLGPDHQSDLINLDTKSNSDAVASTTPAANTSTAKRQ